VSSSQYRIPEKYVLLQLERVLEDRQISGVTPRGLFGSLDDDSWLWALTAGRRESEVLREMLPDLPAEELQLASNGQSGDSALEDGYLVYRLFRRIYEAYRGDLGSAEAILDFGCGWGRIIRFFLKDVEPDRLWGVDVHASQIAACQETTRWGNFMVSKPFPPIEFAEDTFDLVFSYSVFSHLAEEPQRQWLAEFARILKPGGLLIATTWDRQFIQRCHELRDEQQLRPFEGRLSTIFSDTDAWLARYDRGEFCFDSSAEIYGDLSSWYGEACIPEQYVLNHWSKRLEVLDYVDDRGVLAQNVVVARR
jgi:SAM-dependent methyltransferase